MKYEINDYFEILVIIAQVPLVSLTHEKKDWLLSLSWLGFLCITFPIKVFSAGPLLLKSHVPLEKKQLLGSVLVFE